MWLRISAEMISSASRVSTASAGRNSERQISRWRPVSDIWDSRFRATTPSKLATAAFRDFPRSPPPPAVAGAVEQPESILAARSLVISGYTSPGQHTRNDQPTDIFGFVTNNLEFVEIFNSSRSFKDAGGFQLSTASISYTFPPGTSFRRWLSRGGEVRRTLKPQWNYGCARTLHQ